MDYSKPAVVVLVILGALVFYRFQHPSTTFAADGIDPAWDSAVQSRDTTKPTLVLFTAGWCGGCQQMENNVLSRSDVQEELYQHYNVYTVDLTDPSPQVEEHSGKLGIDVIPTLIRYDASGYEQDRIHNSPAEKVLAFLKAGE